MSTNQTFLQRHHQLLRRLHSLSGVFPIGVFLIFHLTTNASIVWGVLNTDKGETFLERGVASYQSEVYFIHKLPFLVLTEIFVLWLPILFHSVLGVYYATSGSNNTARYKYGSNQRYVLQRLTGYVGIVFIFYHIASLRWGWTFLVPGGTQWSYTFASSSLAAALRGSMDDFTLAGALVSVLYFVGVTALVFHFANGLWTAAITWGLTVSQSAQRRWGVACTGLGVMLMALAWSGLIGFLRLDYGEARRTELKLLSPEKRQEMENRAWRARNPEAPEGGTREAPAREETIPAGSHGNPTESAPGGKSPEGQPRP